MAPGRCSHSSGGLTSLVSVLERGHVDGVTVATVRRVAQALGIRLDLMVRWRAGDLDRLLNAGRVLALAAGTPRASAAGVVIAEGDANRRRALAHAATLRSAFPANSDTFVMRLADEAPFHALHRKIASAGLTFLPSSYPFVPHCTLRTRSPVTPEDAAELLATEIPGTMLLDTLSVYTLSRAPTPAGLRCVLRHRTQLRGPISN